MAWTLMRFSRRGDDNLVSIERKLKMQKKYLTVGVSLVLMAATLAMAQAAAAGQEQASQPSGHGRSHAQGKEDHH